MIWNAPRREFFAVLLVALLLACHGAYGINHHYLAETMMPPGVADSNHSPVAAADEQASDSNAVYFTYFMALFALLAILFSLAAKKNAMVLRDIERASSRIPGIQRRLLQLPPRTSSAVLQIFKL